MIPKQCRKDVSRSPRSQKMPLPHCLASFGGAGYGSILKTSRWTGMVEIPTHQNADFGIVYGIGFTTWYWISELGAANRPRNLVIQEMNKTEMNKEHGELGQSCSFNLTSFGVFAIDTPMVCWISMPRFQQSWSTKRWGAMAWADRWMICSGAVPFGYPRWKTRPTAPLLTLSHTIAYYRILLLVSPRWSPDLLIWRGASLTTQQIYNPSCPKWLWSSHCPDKWYHCTNPVSYRHSRRPQLKSNPHSAKPNGFWGGTAFWPCSYLSWNLQIQSLGLFYEQSTLGSTGDSMGTRISACCLSTFRPQGPSQNATRSCSFAKPIRKSQ